jgi:acyl carrier protein
MSLGIGACQKSSFYVFKNATTEPKLQSKSHFTQYNIVVNLDHIYFNEAYLSMTVRLRIISAMQQIAAEQQVTLPPLNDDLPLQDTGFDSLGFAILVARLEDDLGIDPFTTLDAAFPLTMADLVRAYENASA